MPDPKWQFIPADDDGNLDESQAIEVEQNDDGSFELPDGPVHTIGSVEADGSVSYDHPEVEP
jgi:hypothetical protein